MDNQTRLVAVAEAEDTQNLLDHIAWTHVIQPKLNKLKESYGKMLVNHLLGVPLPEGLTKEQLAGRIYGIEQMASLFENILRQGEKAFTELESRGIHISS